MNLILLSTLESIVESRTRAAGGPGGCVTVVTADEQARSVLNDSFNRKHGEILDTVEKIQSVPIRFNPFLYMFCRR